MKKRMKFVAFLMTLSFFTGQGFVLAEAIQGTVIDVNQARKTFQICPKEEGCGVTEDNVFMVQTGTHLEGLRSVWELDVGDRVTVEGEPLNEVVWTATSVTKE